MTTSKVSSGREDALPNLVNTLLVTWVCSILWGGGLFFSIVAFLSAVMVGLLNFFGPPNWDTSTTIMLTAGLISALFSPVLLGTVISHSWRRGIKVGLFASMIAIITLSVTWIGNGIFGDWAHSWPSYLYLSYENLITLALDFSLILIISLTAFATIKFLTLSTKLYSYSFFELVLSAIVIIGLSAVSRIVLGDLLTDNNIFHFIWQIPLLVWISTIYLPELLAGRSQPIGFIIWAFLTLISFGLPFVIVPLFPLK